MKLWKDLKAGSAKALQPRTICHQIKVPEILLLKLHLCQNWLVLFPTITALSLHVISYSQLKLWKYPTLVARKKILVAKGKGGRRYGWVCCEWGSCLSGWSGLTSSQQGALLAQEAQGSLFSKYFACSLLTTPHNISNPHPPNPHSIPATLVPEETQRAKHWWSWNLENLLVVDFVHGNSQRRCRD